MCCAWCWHFFYTIHSTTASPGQIGRGQGAGLHIWAGRGGIVQAEQPFKHQFGYADL